MGTTTAAPKTVLDWDPHYQALRLQGLAGLIRAAGERLHEPTTAPIALFIASTLDEIADALGHWGRRS
jgi:hypothetical protein